MTIVKPKTPAVTIVKLPVIKQNIPVAPIVKPPVTIVKTPAVKPKTPPVTIVKPPVIKPNIPAVPITKEIISTKAQTSIVKDNLIGKPFKVGDYVSYIYKKQAVRGVITKINAKTAGVKTNGITKNIEYSKLTISNAPKAENTILVYDRIRYDNIIDRNIFIDPVFPDVVRPTLTYPVVGNYDYLYIGYYRDVINKAIHLKYYRINQPNAILDDAMLVDMWELYDKYFFQGHLAEILRSTNTQLQIGFSDKPSNTYSYCALDGCVYKILFNASSINSLSTQRLLVGSTLCDNKIHCCMNEIQQAIIRFIIFANPNYDSTNPMYDMDGIWFRELLLKFFCVVYQPEKNAILYNKDHFSIDQVVKYRYSLVDTAYGKITKLDNDGAYIEDTYHNYGDIYPVSDRERDAYEHHRGLYIVSHEKEIKQKPHISIDAKTSTYNIPRISFPVKERYSEEFVIQHRNIIHQELVSKYGLIGDVTEELLEDMYRAYDKYFFNNFISDTFKDNEMDFIITLDFSMGLYAVVIRSYSYIAMHFSKKFFNRLDSKITPGFGNVARETQCYDIMMCMQLIMEHELCHVLAYIGPHNLNYNVGESDDTDMGVHGLYFLQLYYAFFAQKMNESIIWHDTVMSSQYNIGDYLFTGIITKYRRKSWKLQRITYIDGDTITLESGRTGKSTNFIPANPKILREMRESIYYDHDSLINIKGLYEPLPRFEFPMTMSYTPEYIRHNAQNVSDSIVAKYANNNPSLLPKIDTALLKDLYLAIDLYFFKGYIFANSHVDINFEVTTATENEVLASCSRQGCNYNVNISNRVLQEMSKAINSDPNKLHTYNSMACSNLLDCIIIVLFDSAIELLSYMIQTSQHIIHDPRDLFEFKRQLRLSFFNY